MTERIVAGVRLSSPDKVLFAEQGITKAALAEYYVAVADRILPQVALRPVTLVRCPAGSEGKCFYQRHAGSGPRPPHQQRAQGPACPQRLCARDGRDRDRPPIASGLRALSENEAMCA